MIFMDIAFIEVTNRNLWSTSILPRIVFLFLLYPDETIFLVLRLYYQVNSSSFQNKGQNMNFKAHLKLIEYVRHKRFFKNDNIIWIYFRKLFISNFFYWIAPSNSFILEKLTLILKTIIIFRQNFETMFHFICSDCKKICLEWIASMHLFQNFFQINLRDYIDQFFCNTIQKKNLCVSFLLTKDS